MPTCCIINVLAARCCKFSCPVGCVHLLLPFCFAAVAAGLNLIPAALPTAKRTRRPSASCCKTSKRCRKASWSQRVRLLVVPRVCASSTKGTSSYTLRQVKGRLQTTQILLGRFSFLTPLGIALEPFIAATSTVRREDAATRKGPYGHIR